MGLRASQIPCPDSGTTILVQVTSKLDIDPDPKLSREVKQNTATRALIDLLGMLAGGAPTRAR